MLAEATVAWAVRTICGLGVVRECVASVVEDLLFQLPCQCGVEGTCNKGRLHYYWTYGGSAAGYEPEAEASTHIGAYKMRDIALAGGG